MQTAYEVLRSLVRRLVRRSAEASVNYHIVEPNEKLDYEALHGWRHESVAASQDAAYRRIIRNMYAGNVRQDLLAAAEAFRFTGLSDPDFVEIGCGSGYYSEILPYLLGVTLRYTGIDYSIAMINLAKERYSKDTFVVGDATLLPFAHSSFDIAFNGVSLMHITDHKAAIAESRRISRRWCIFHTVPVVHNDASLLLTKRAYGQPTIEHLFNEEELFDHFSKCGLRVVREINSLPYDLKPVIGKVVQTKTFVCTVDSE